ncbi:MAG: hypothetical protein HQK60_04110 [Deltaproteobacteria bacterium]|nr:hypothetical protein [Deltaproteobacteria bacterium]
MKKVTKTSSNLLHFLAGLFVRPAAALCLTVFFLITPASSSGAGDVIFFYSSETNVNNFKSLKMKFDQYLSELGSYEFQPFNDRMVFEQYIKDKRNGFLLLSSWHYNHIYREYGLKPVLVGTKGGKKYQKMILATKGESGKDDLLAIDPLASASSVAYTRSVLRGMLRQKETTDSVSILTVPKDIDALVSVGFGMSKSALAAESTLDQLKTINPALYKEVKVMAEGRESLSLVLAAPKNWEPLNAAMLKIIKEMPLGSRGKELIEMIGLDGWKELDPADVQKLESK